MSRVLFTHSYFLRFDPKEYRAMAPYAPLGTLAAAAVARAAGHEVFLHDVMFAESEEEIRGAIAHDRPSVVVIYDDDFNYLTKMCLRRMRDASFAMSSIARASGCTVVVHGSDPVDHVADYLAHGADYVLCGEGEKTLVDLLGHLSAAERTPPTHISGLAFLDRGTVHRTPARRVMTDLDSLPFPARDLVDVNAYRSRWLKHHGVFSVNLVTTRGCPYHCNWCAKPLYGQTYNCRTPGNVAAEIEELRQTWQPDHLWFCDDIFGLQPGWVGAFRDELVRRDCVIPFKCLSRADLLLRGSTISELRAAGCESVWLGAESGSQKVLDAMEKGITVQQIEKASGLLHQAGIRIGFFIQYGYPGETRADIDATLAMVKRCKPDDIGVSVSYPLPGTTFYESVRHALGEKTNWENSADLDPLLPGPFSREFYRALHRVTHKSLRLWQGVDLWKARRSQPWLWSPAEVRRLGSAVYHAAGLPRARATMNRLARDAR